MKEFVLIKLIIRNFRSFTDELVTFPQTTGLKLLSGENVVEPRLGANGSGKSSLWDALEWCLHGASVRGGKTSSIVSWGATQAEVIAEFMLGSLSHTIRRYGPPMKIEIDDGPATQEEIDELIGLSRQCFLHSVVFGQSVSLFPDLSIPERGNLLDEVLALNIWQLATDAAGKKHTSLSNELNKKQVDISFLEGMITALPSDKELKIKIDNWEQEKVNKVIHLQKESNAWEDKQKSLIKNLKEEEEAWKDKIICSAEEKARSIEELEAEIAPLVFETENEVINPFSGQIAIAEKQLKTAEQLRDGETKIIHQAEHEYKSCVISEGFWDKDVCPTCAQPITENKKKHELDCVEKVKVFISAKKTEAERLLAEAELDVDKYKKQLSELKAISIREDEKKKSTRREIDRVRSHIKILEIEGKRIIHQLDRNENPFSKQLADLHSNPFVKQLEDETVTPNPFIIERANVKKERSKLINDFALAQADFKKTESQMLSAEFWRDGFKRIRLYFVKQVLAALQVEIQSAISALGLEGWEVTLSTESETKSLTIKLGVQIHIKSPISEGTWDVWSGGETQRLRIAIAMGLASLIQRASGVYFSFEVWDEPTKHLSGEGVEDLLEALRYRSESMNKQIWLTDHSALTYSGFREIWSAVKGTRGSKIIKISESEV